MAAASNKRMTKEKIEVNDKNKKKMKVFLKAMLQEKADRKLRERELQKRQGIRQPQKLQPERKHR